MGYEFASLLAVKDMPVEPWWRIFSDGNFIMLLIIVGGLIYWMINGEDD